MTTAGERKEQLFLSVCRGRPTEEVVGQLRLQLEAGDDFFGIEREVAVHHPLVIARVASEDFDDEHTFVLAEVEYFSFFVVVYDTSRIVDVFIVRRVLRQEVDSVFQVAVPTELSLEYFEGSHRIGFGAVSIAQVFAAIEFVRCRQVAGFLLVENHHDVDELTSLEVDVDIGTQELLDEQRDIEVYRVVPRQVATFNIFGYTCGDLSERRAIGHILIVYTVYGRSLFGYVHLRIDS